MNTIYVVENVGTGDLIVLDDVYNECEEAIVQEFEDYEDDIPWKCVSLYNCLYHLHNQIKKPVYNDEEWDGEKGYYAELRNMFERWVYIYHSYCDKLNERLNEMFKTKISEIRSIFEDIEQIEDYGIEP